MKSSKRLFEGKRVNLRDLQKEMAQSGELINTDVTETNSENKIGQLLLDAKIHLYPQFKLGEKSFDFKIKHYPILIEIDGGVHREEKVRGKDYIKDRAAIIEGFKVMRFSNYEVATEPDMVIREVRAAISKSFRQKVEILLYPLTLKEQIVIWWRKITGKKEYEGINRIQLEKL